MQIAVLNPGSAVKTPFPPLVLALVLLSTVGCMTESYLRRGDAAFAAGRPEEALRYYEQVHRRSSKYRADPAFESKMQQTRVQALIVQARRDMGGRLWDAAIAKLQDALALDPGSGSAVQLLAQAKRGAADSALAQACRLADQGHLAEAGQECGRGLAYEPMHVGLLQAQQSLSPQAPAQQELAEAARLADDHRWLQADRVLSTLLESHPYHLAARSRRSLVQGQLKEEERLLSDAQTRSRQGDLVGAQSSLRRLLKGSPHNREATELLADVESRLAQGRALLAEAKQAEGQGRAGLALDRLGAVRSVWPKGVSAADVTRLEGVLRGMYPVELSWEASGHGVEFLQGALSAKLGEGPRREAPDQYHLVVQVQAGAGRVETLRTERLQHSYVTRETHPNPEIPALHQELLRCEGEERMRSKRYEDAVREFRRAQRHMSDNDPERRATLRRLADEVDRRKAQLDDAANWHEHAARRLRAAPRTVVVERTQYWPYVRRRMRKTVTVTVTADMTFAGERVVQPVSYSRSATSEDVMVEGANPRLGLAADGLALASDQSLAAGAAAALAEDVAAWAEAASREAWAAQLQASAQELERQGVRDEALELKTAAQAYRKLAGR